jgi:hypothetical protein
MGSLLVAAICGASLSRIFTVVDIYAQIETGATEQFSNERVEHNGLCTTLGLWGSEQW